MSSRLSGGRFSISDMLVVVRPLTPVVELSRSRSVAHMSHSSLWVNTITHGGTQNTSTPGRKLPR